MSGGNKFLHICYTSYHCYEYRKSFRCKQRNKESPEEREKLNKEDKVPICDLCKIKHFRCKGKKCKMCCKKNDCSTYPCNYCVENDLECKYTIIQSDEEFKKFKKKGMIYFGGQLENTKNGKVHVQGY
ncbi:3428_t:CDS:1, partial [Scutellospora calospora]